MVNYKIGKWYFYIIRSKGKATIGILLGGVDRIFELSWRSSYGRLGLRDDKDLMITEDNLPF